MARINLLPWRERQRKERTQAFFIALGTAFMAAIAVTYSAHVLLRTQIGVQHVRNQRLRSEIGLLDAQVREMSQIDTQRRQLMTRMRIIDSLSRSRLDVVRMFAELVELVPADVHLTALTQTAHRLHFEGIARTPAGVSEFSHNIDSARWLRKSSLAGVERKTGLVHGTAFVIDAEQVSTP